MRFKAFSMPLRTSDIMAATIESLQKIPALDGFTSKYFNASIVLVNCSIVGCSIAVSPIAIQGLWRDAMLTLHL